MQVCQEPCSSVAGYPAPRAAGVLQSPRSQSRLNSVWEVQGQRKHESASVVKLRGPYAPLDRLTGKRQRESGKTTSLPSAPNVQKTIKSEAFQSAGLCFSVTSFQPISPRFLLERDASSSLMIVLGSPLNGRECPFHFSLTPHPLKLPNSLSALWKGHEACSATI